MTRPLRLPSDTHLRDEAGRVARATAAMVQPGVAVERVKGTAGHPDGHDTQREARQLTRESDETRAHQAGVTSYDGVGEGTQDPEHGRRPHQDAQHRLGQALGHGVRWCQRTEQTAVTKFLDGGRGRERQTDRQTKKKTDREKDRERERERERDELS